MKLVSSLLIILFIIGFSLSGYVLYANYRKNSTRGVSCGGWDTSGEVICHCSGKLIKPTCKPNTQCDSATYSCVGQCTDCCYQGIAVNHPLPKCDIK